MSAPRIIPAGPMRHDDILPLIREVGSLRERGEYGIAAELEERIRQPITVAGRVMRFTRGENGWLWWCHEVMMTARADAWHCVLTAMGDDTAIQVQTQGSGPTIADALSDAHARYQAAIADTLLRMADLLREVATVPAVRCPRCLGCKVTISGFDDVAHRCHVCGGAGEVVL